MAESGTNNRRTQIGSHKPVEETANEASAYVWVIGGVIAAIFTWLQIRDIPITDALSATNAQYAINVGLALYYLCWVTGTKIDISVQKSIYIEGPPSRYFDPATLAYVAALGVAAACLLWFRKDDRGFAVTILVFCIVTTAAWRHLVGRVRPMIEASRRRYLSMGDYAGLEKVELLEAYLDGRWQRVRVAVLSLFVIMLVVATFSRSGRIAMSNVLVQATPTIQPEAVYPWVSAINFLAFVVISETTQWWMRLRTWVVLKALDHLESKYAFIPKPL